MSPSMIRTGALRKMSVEIAMRVRRASGVAALGLLFLAVRGAFAGEIKPYNQAEVEKLAAEGKPTLLDFSASWCATCAAQAPLLRDLMAQSKYKDLTMFTVDFDKDTELLTKYDVPAQSTLIVFSGKKEEGRSVGDTNRNDIAALLNKVIR